MYPRTDVFASVVVNENNMVSAQFLTVDVVAVFFLAACDDLDTLYHGCALCCLSVCVEFVRLL